MRKIWSHSTSATESYGKQAGSLAGWLAGWQADEIVLNLEILKLFT